ncbi:hypothetical protein ACVGVM_00090 [Pseudonocardia bannensis]|uniref:Integral membrane protein n=1 Tax=Pseudonocardia bannensis TaxID=630973 RepID=A0A848DG14_9PSEU|nr:hypothetical protein [Pseudonocardia bannensis]NMH91505.1 hypothetical protein [Pseudonocardia bannensis]
MTAPSSPPVRPAPAGRARLLRSALQLDALASGLLGIAAVTAAPLLTELLGISPGLLRGAGAFLVVFAAALLALGSRPVVAAGGVRVVVALNIVWVLGSLVGLAAGWSALTTLGLAFVLVQAGAVAVLADLQWTGLRRLSSR